jgi:ABC-2 type transport system permease protein
MTTAELEATEVRGPSAVSGDWRRFIRLTWILASTDFKLSYFGSVLGYLWSLIQPLLFFGVLYVVFAVILKLQRGVPDFPVLLLMNIVLFNFFVGATSAAVPSVVVREGLVRKMQFPRLVIPLATVLTAAMNLVLNVVVVLVFMLVYGLEPRLTWLLLPVILAALLILAAGVAMLLSALYVRYRDVAPIWGVVSQTLFYASPIFITIENIQARAPGFVRYYLFNPIATILQAARHWMIGGKNVYGPAVYMGGKVWLLVPLGLLVGTVVLGFVVYSRRAPLVAEEL